jgi:hypothetical protein
LDPEEKSKGLRKSKVKGKKVILTYKHTDFIINDVFKNKNLFKICKNRFIICKNRFIFAKKFIALSAKQPVPTPSGLTLACAGLIPCRSPLPPSSPKPPPLGRLRRRRGQR